MNQVYGTHRLVAYNWIITNFEGAQMNPTGTNDMNRSGLDPLQPFRQLGLYLAAYARLLESWRRRQQLSAELAHIDAHTLHDAGISDAQRFMGINRPFD